MRNKYKSGLFIFASFFVSTLFGQIPANYYEKANNKKSEELKTVLFSIIHPHKQLDYGELWDVFIETDANAKGHVWDMYSSATDYTFLDSQCGTYDKEGDCYNREHSFPKNWFNDEFPMFTDLFHIYPTDGKVNGVRSNYPFGETDDPTYYSLNDFCKLGPCSFPESYQGIVFEPSDLYKGDFARSYFYMVTCYENVVSTWKSPMIASNSYPALSDWAIELLLKWARIDPVSPKETKRNEAVCQIQSNRNPFIDYPGLEEYIWGNMRDSIFNTATFVPRLSADTVTYAQKDVIPELLTLAEDDILCIPGADGTGYSALGAYVTSAYVHSFLQDKRLPIALREKVVIGLCLDKYLQTGIAKGEVTQSSVSRIQPSDHTLVAYLLTGKELKQLLNETQADKENFLQTSHLQITIKKEKINKLEYTVKKWGVNDNSECVVVFDSAMLADEGESFRNYFTENNAITSFKEQQINTTSAFIKYLATLGTKSTISTAKAPVPTVTRK